MVRHKHTLDTRITNKIRKQIFTANPKLEFRRNSTRKMLTEMNFLLSHIGYLHKDIRLTYYLRMVLTSCPFPRFYAHT